MDEIFRNQSIPTEFCLVNVETRCRTMNALFRNETCEYLHFLSHYYEHWLAKKA